MDDRYDRWGHGRQAGGIAGWSGVTTLLAINTAVFLLCVVDRGHLVDFLALNGYGIRRLQFWKAVTYMFTHQDFLHIAMNMWSLWIFGKLVERALGKARLIRLHLFSGLIGAAVWLLANWHSASCIGASGATFGIMAAAAVAFPDVQLHLLFPPVPVRLRTFAICLALLEIFYEFSATDQIAHLAHLGGMLGALIFMRQLAPGFAGKPFFRTRAYKRYFKNYNAKTDRLGGLSSREVDRILDKMAETGRSSLTPEELETLNAASRRLRDNRIDPEDQP